MFQSTYSESAASYICTSTYVMTDIRRGVYRRRRSAHDRSSHRHASRASDWSCSRLDHGVRYHRGEQSMTYRYRLSWLTTAGSQDMYEPHERGTRVGIYYAFVSLSKALYITSHHNTTQHHRRRACSLKKDRTYILGTWDYSPFSALR